MLTIILDAATGVSTVILANNDSVIAKRSSPGKALTQLHTFIRDVLREGTVRMSEVERIGVIQGPGSWTGLHIAISAAKTLAQVNNVPLIPLSFIDALAFSSRRERGSVGAIYSSPNEKYFFRSYEDDGNRIVPTSEHQKLTISAVMEIVRKIGRPFRLIGEIPNEIVSEIENFGECQISTEKISYPSDVTLIRMINDPSWEAKSSNDMMFLEPLYMQSEGEGPRLFGERK